MNTSDYKKAAESLVIFNMFVHTVNYGVKYDIKNISKRLKNANEILNK